MTPRGRKSSPLQAGGPPSAFNDKASEGVDVQRIHMNIVGREKEEPEEGFEPTPWWVWTASVLVLFAMGFYLGRYGGSFSPVAHEVENPAQTAAAPARPAVKGDVVYAGVCQACHQTSGRGIAGQYPPLPGSEWLLQDPETPVRIVLFGLEGEIAVGGSQFNNKMPPFHDKLSNEEIAAVLTHVRSAWGNAASAVSVALVDSLRLKTPARGPWSAAELNALRKRHPS
ncbi:MAG: cytochrome c [Bacteroidota bacterium]